MKLACSTQKSRKEKLKPHNLYNLHFSVACLDCCPLNIYFLVGYSCVAYLYLFITVYCLLFIRKVINYSQNVIAYLFSTWIPAVDYGIKIINPGAHAAHNPSVVWILAIPRNTDVLVLPTSLAVTDTFALTYKITVNITFF